MILPTEENYDDADDAETAAIRLCIDAVFPNEPGFLVNDLGKPEPPEAGEKESGPLREEPSR